MQFHTKSALDPSLNAGILYHRVDSCSLSPRNPDFNGISEYESSNADSKDKDSRFSKSCEFRNPDYFTLCDHYIVLKPSLSIAYS